MKYYCIKTLFFNNDYKKESPIFIADNCYEKTNFYDIRDTDKNVIAITYNNYNHIYQFNIKYDSNYPDIDIFSDYFITLKEYRNLKLQKLNSI